MVDRRSLGKVLMLAGVALLGAWAVPGAAVAAPPCAAVTGGVTYPTVQEGVDAAAPGRTLRVKGTCEGDVTISKNMRITGQGPATVTANPTGSNTTSVITVNDGATVRITGLTVSGGEGISSPGIQNLGTLKLVDSTITGNRGGGIDNEGSLTLIRSTVSHNASTGVGGIASSGTLELRSSTVADNTTFISGGGIDVVSGSLSVESSTVSGNEAGVAGGGIYSNGSIKLVKSAVTGNRTYAGPGHCNICRSGGGIAHDGGSLTVASSTIAENHAEGEGGGIYNTDAADKLTGSTVTGNTAARGGGIATRASSPELGTSLTLTNTHVTRNAVAAVAAFEGVTGGEGGGIFNGANDSLVLIGSSSVTENKAETDGGGVFNAESAGATISFAPNWRGTISGNEPDDIFNG